MRLGRHSAGADRRYRRSSGGALAGGSRDSPEVVRRSIVRGCQVTAGWTSLRGQSFSRSRKRRPRASGPVGLSQTRHKIPWHYAVPISWSMKDMSTSTDTCQLSDVTGALERREYQRIPSESDGKLWYVSSKSTATAEQYVVLEHKKTFRIYGVYIGFSNSEIRDLRNVLLKSTLFPTIKQLNGKARCWSTFDVGRALNWPLLGIPYPRERSHGMTQFTQMTEYLAAVLEPVDGPAAILERLLSTDVPFDWAGLNHAVGRAVEVVATAKVIGHPMQDVQTKLLAAQADLYKELKTGTRWPELIARICGC